MNLLGMISSNIINDTNNIIFNRNNNTTNSSLTNYKTSCHYNNKEHLCCRNNYLNKGTNYLNRE